jgi:hypothetical protein
MASQYIKDAFRLEGQRKLTPIEHTRIENIKQQAAVLATLFHPTDEPEKKLAMQKLEECVMWATKGISK